MFQIIFAEPAIFKLGFSIAMPHTVIYPLPSLILLFALFNVLEIRVCSRGDLSGGAMRQ